MPHLMRHVGERLARWLLLTGELIDATTAERVGFVNAVSDDLMTTVRQWVASLAEGGPEAPRQTRELFRTFFASSVIGRASGPGIGSASSIGGMSSRD
jgi:methylglutaconyl-CoA hydratase